MKSKLYLLLVISIVYFIQYGETNAAGKSFIPLNTANDEKAIAITAYKNYSVEAYITTSNNCLNKSSKHIMKYSPNSSYRDMVNINQHQDNSKRSYDGCLTFPACLPYLKYKFGVMVSNRNTADGKYHGNDLYEVYFDDNGELSMKRRLDELSTDYWEDTPSLSPDGQTMYFASDRANPGSGKTDLYYSKMLGEKWSSPKMLDFVNSSDYSEQSPCASPDGKSLYFSTNKSGDYDIWVIELDNQGLPKGDAKSMNEGSVNQKNSDEFPSCFSNGGVFFIYTSNVDESKPNTPKDYDLYYIRNNHNINISIELNAEIREQVFNPIKLKPEVISKPCITTIDVGMNGGEHQKFQTDNSGPAIYNFSTASVKTVWDDIRINQLVLKINGCSDAASCPLDTLLLDVFADKDKFKYNIICWKGYKPPDSVYFDIRPIPFFVTGYWCLSTRDYKDKLFCTSVIDMIKPLPELPEIETKSPLKDNEVFTYSVTPAKYTPKVNKTRINYACISLNEPINEFADSVDLEIKKAYDEMYRVLKSPFFQEAIEKGKTIRIEVLGWTDQRTIDNACKYTGEDIDIAKSFVSFDKAKMEKDYIKDNTIESKQRFIGKDFGNEMLSDLRAWYSALFFDNLWQSIPVYKDLRDKEVQRRSQLTANDKSTQKPYFEVIAKGCSIKEKLELSNPMRRSIDIQAIIVDDNKVRKPNEVIAQGVKVSLWLPDCR
jgi:hypothetical protein